MTKLLKKLSGIALGAALVAAPAFSAFAEEVAHEAAEAAAEHGESLGFPQLQTDTYAAQVFWLIVAFILLYTLMSKIALPRVGSVLEARRAEREGNLGIAENLQKEAEEKKTAYAATLAKAQEQAQSALKSAEEDIGDKINAENTRFADHARKRLLTAEQTISKAKEDALQSLADISADVAVEMVQKIAAVTVTKADAKKIVTTVMQKEGKAA